MREDSAMSWEEKEGWIEDRDLQRVLIEEGICKGKIYMLSRESRAWNRWKGACRGCLV